MAVPTPARRTAPRPARTAQQRPANLRVVRPDHRVRVVGTMGTAVVITFFVVLFAIAGLHAVLVQTQARIDAQRSANAEIQLALDEVRATLAFIDSPEGLETWARQAGLVQAPEVLTLGRIAPGALPPPPSADPFGEGAG